MIKSKLAGIQFQNGITVLFALSALTSALLQTFGKPGADISMMSSDTSVEFGNLTINDGQTTDLGISQEQKSVLKLFNAQSANIQAGIKYVPVIFADGEVVFLQTTDIPSAVWSGKTHDMGNITLSSDVPFQIGALVKSNVPYQATNVQQIGSTDKPAHGGFGSGHAQQNAGQPVMAA